MKALALLLMLEATAFAGGFEVPDDLTRLSLGIEHFEDLWWDLERMLTRAESVALAAR